ncbi:ABC transporter permease [Advenella sp. S44]|uniref:ABC transporter permease n=1 Tax=Advenella sp. S44 TaxID=1982755 RepID=UPI000C2A9E8C|nr:iron ABC transporter permease [Advenella sp. S44]PJX26910.1 ABC transporter permease [Advenella sp. S44]
MATPSSFLQPFGKAPASVLTPVLLCLVLMLALLPPARLVMMAMADLPSQDSAMWSMLSNASTWRATGNSLITAGLATLLSVLLGTTLALLVVLTDIRAKGFWVFMIMLPMMIPPQVTALSWLQLSGPGSTLLQMLDLAPPLGSPQHLRSWWGISMLMGIQHAPLVYLAVRASLIALPKELIEAARLAGASQHDVVRDMILPLCRNGLLAGAAIAFVSALGNFGIPAMLGIPVSYYVLPTLIYQKMADFGPDMLADVSSLSVIIGVIALVGVVAQQRFSSRMPLTGMPGSPLAFSLGRRRWQAELALFLLVTAIVVVPLIALISSSLVAAMGIPLSWETVSLQAYEQVIFHQSVTLRAFSNSILLAGSASLILASICLPLGYLFVRFPSRSNAFLQGAIDIPYALPGVVLAVACILLFARPLPLVQITLYGTLGLILFAYLSRFMTVCLKPIQSSMQQLDPALEEAAQLCGAGPVRRLRDIVFPLLAPAAFAGMLLVFLIAVNELTVSALLWSAGNETLGVLVFNLDDGGETVLASAVSVLIVLMVLVLMLCLNVLGRRVPRGVIPWRN